LALTPEEHAVFSCSACDREITCTASVLAVKDAPREEHSWSIEGSSSHCVAAYRLSKALGLDVDEPFDDLPIYNKDMETYAADYVEYVLDKKSQCKNPKVYVEEKVKSDRFEDVYGTCDCAIVNDTVMYTIDYKYGVGVPVSAINNSQLKLYSILLLDTFGALYDIKTIRLCIFQPRLGNVSEWEISVEDLMKWCDEILTPAVKKALSGEGEFHPSKHCRFCPIKERCKALKEANMQVQEKQIPPYLMTNEELETVLERADEIIAWLNSIKDYALGQALNGETFKNFKLVEGRATRSWIDEEAVASLAKENGIDPYTSSLMSVSALEKEIGKKKFRELFEALSMKPKGKPTLVTRDDKREEISPAKLDFK